MSERERERERCTAISYLSFQDEPLSDAATEKLWYMTSTLDSKVKDMDELTLNEGRASLAVRRVGKR